MDDEPVRRGEYQHTRLRRERLVEMLDEHQGSGNVQQLATELGVSVSTVRRDLAQLETEHRIARTYGGAIDPARLDRSWRVKSTERLAQKRALARWAASRVQSGSTVLLDSGTTVAEVAALLGERDDITLATNGLSSLLALADTRAEVLVLGGRLRRPSESIVGTATLQALQRLTADTALLGAEALDAARGVNCPEGDQAAVKELMASGAREVWVLADSSKLERQPGFSYWAPMPDGCGIVTDSAVEEHQLAPFREAGWCVEVI
ncbi:DeoR/GlpR family DNA-binding transcription regulator [Leucobacter sp. GX24907]